MGDVSLPAGYDPAIGARLCFLSNLAYDCFRKEKQNPGGSVCVNNFAFVIREEGGKILVGIQGSNDVKDFLLDLMARITNPDDEPTYPAVHRGFWKASRTILQPLLEELGKCGQGPLYLGGHSLGGGMATLLAALLQEGGVHVTGVYGFGTPPVGAIQFYNHYRRLGLHFCTYLLVYGRDGIPFLQPCGVHVVTLIFMDARAYLLSERPPFAWLNPFRWRAWRTDHSCDKYMPALYKIEDRMRLGT